MRMSQSKITNLITVLLLVFGLAEAAGAQLEAGACAGVQGTVEVQHAGAWQQAGVGTAVLVGDHVRTGAQSRTTIVLRDDSVLDLAPNTELALETQESDKSAHRDRSLLRLASGKIRAWVSAAYSEAGARYEVETPTAVSVVRGTEFIVSYDGVTESTEIVALEGQVEVHAKLAVTRAGVEVGPRFFTRVSKGRSPVRPQRVNAARMSQYLDGVDLVGTGRRDGLNVLHPAVVGHVLAPQDVPSPDEASIRSPEEATGLTVQSPLPGSVADTLSPDVYTNTQPLRDYQQTPPGQVPTY
jgi:hypothetical protein